MGEPKRPRGSVSHDAAYRRLFSHPELIRDLLLGFVPEPWVKDLEFDSLERVNAFFVDDRLRRRESDVIWRIRLRDRWVYIYVLLEFQSTVDRTMAVRLLTYVALLYQQLIHGGQLDGNRLPPVLPVVLYNGDIAWNAPVALGELLHEMPEGLERYQPRFEYLLLDERHTEPRSLPERNLLTAVFRLERRAEPPELLAALGHLVDWLRLPDQAELAKAFVVWIENVVASAYPDIHAWGKAEDLLEMRTMISDGVQEWVERIRHEGLQKGLNRGLEQGRQEGLQEGRNEGERQGLLEALEVTLTSHLPEVARMLIEEARGVQDVNRLKAALRAAVAPDSTPEAVKAALRGE